MRSLTASLLALSLSSCGDRTASQAAAEQQEAGSPEPSEEAGALTAERAPTGRSQVVLLGTGTPVTDPERSGPSVAVVVDHVPYLVDCGPGVVRRAEAASRRGVKGLSVELLERAFITHLHSDHTAGYPDLILTPWPMGRAHPLEVYGPPGIDSMTSHLLKAYEQDIEVRLAGEQPATSEGWKVRSHEISEAGEIYRDPRVKVEAFPVEHDGWRFAFGYRFSTADGHRVVISGDTTAVDATVEACDGCDLLIHEVYAQAGFLRRSDEWRAYHAAAHTSSVALGELAARARPKRLVLYHQLLFGASEQSVLRDIRKNFDGEVIWGEDLDVFEL